MALKRFVERFTKPVEELDRERLDDFVADLGLDRLDAIELRRPARYGGEVRSVRIVPRAGADALEVAISDGRGMITAVFLGRRKVLGISPGRRLAIEGVAGRDGARVVVYNPVYTLF